MLCTIFNSKFITENQFYIHFYKDLSVIMAYKSETGPNHFKFISFKLFSQYQPHCRYVTNKVLHKDLKIDIVDQLAKKKLY